MSVRIYHCTVRLDCSVYIESCNYVKLYSMNKLYLILTSCDFTHFSIPDHLFHYQNTCSILLHIYAREMVYKYIYIYIWSRVQVWKTCCLWPKALTTVSDVKCADSENPLADDDTFLRPGPYQCHSNTVHTNKIQYIRFIYSGTCPLRPPYGSPKCSS